VDEVIIASLRNAGLPEVGINAKRTGEAIAASGLTKLGEEFGRRVERGDDRHTAALRESLRLDPAKIRDSWRSGKDEWADPHRRGEVLVAAVLRTLRNIWVGRIADLAPRGASLKLVAEEGARSAEHLLTMVIRSLDYAPPVEMEFEDFLDAILASDEFVAPDDDKHDYRGKLREAFGAFGIKQPVSTRRDLWKDPPTYSSLNFGEFLIDPDEVWRFIWQNGEKLGIDVRNYYTRVEDVQPSIRVGPDGLVIRETVASYIQTIEGRLSDVISYSRVDVSERPKDDTNKRREALAKPVNMPEHAMVQLWGGGVLIFDQFGRPKCHQHKDVDDWARQGRRLSRLAQKAPDPDGRFGFDGADGARLSHLHDPAADERREW
jgi:hypothetical protein